METSERMIDGSRRLLLAVAATAGAIFAVWGGATGASASADGQPAAFRWLQPQPAPHAWKLARLPSGAASVGYPRSWRPIRTDAGTASVALIEHVGDEEHTKDVRLIASAHGLRFRSGKGSCVIDSYPTSRTRYREIACLVAGTRTTSVVVGAAPTAIWAQQAKTIQRAIASL